VHLRQQVRSRRDELVKYFDVARGFGFTDTMAMPGNDYDLEEFSFNLHARLRSEVSEPSVTDGEIRHVVYLAEKLLRPCRWNVDQCEDTLDNWKLVRERNIKMSSNPGLPYCHDFPTNEEFFQHDARVEQLFATRNDEQNPIRVFIKQEVHSRKKLDEGRVRLISNIDVKTQMRQHVLFGPSNNAYVDHWDETPIVYGFSNTGGNFGKLASRFMVPGTIVVEADKKCWDWTMPEWVTEASLRLRRNLADGEPDKIQDWEERAREEYRRMYGVGTVMQLSSGKAFSQRTAGLQKSGSVVTISLNSEAQLFLHLLTLIRLRVSDQDICSAKYRFIVGGDDTLNLFPDSFDVSAYVETMRQLGCKLDEPKIHDGLEGAEFFSWRFSKHEDYGWVGVPVRFDKHFSTLLMNVKDEFLDQALGQQAELYAFAPEVFHFLTRIHRELGLDPKTRVSLETARQRQLGWE